MKGLSRSVLLPGFLILAAAVFLLALSLAGQVKLPAPGGLYPVGRTSLGWLDASRPEVLTEASSDFRYVGVQIWYPAQKNTGTPSAYFPDLERVRSALVESGEVSGLQAAGLGWMRSNSFWQAQVAQQGGPFPVLVLSPGNGTNVEFYSGLAEELASLGYIVVGINHPYDVPAVVLDDGQVAGYDKAQWDLTPQQHQHYTQERVAVRVEDALFVLSRLEVLNGEDGLFTGRLDLKRLGFLGHSLGGIAASQACQLEKRFKACLNLDGIQAGGPFGTAASPALPSQPFLFITKEEQLHPGIIEQFKALPGRGYLVVIHGASHNHFTDGPLLQPSILPFENQSDRILKEVRRYTAAFFEQELYGATSLLLQKPYQDQLVRVALFP